MTQPFTINSKYLQFVLEASRTMFRYDAVSIFAFMINPGNYKVTEIKAFINVARSYPELTRERMPARKDDLVRYANKIVALISAPDPVNQAISLNEFIYIQNKYPRDDPYKSSQYNYYDQQQSLAQYISHQPQQILPMPAFPNTPPPPPQSSSPTSSSFSPSTLPSTFPQQPRRYQLRPQVKQSYYSQQQPSQLSMGSVTPMQQMNQMQMRQRALDPKYQYLNSDFVYMNNGARAHSQTNIDEFYQSGAYGMNQPPPQAHRLSEPKMQIGFASQQAQLGDPMAYTSTEFAERQNPSFTVEKRVAAVWLGINTPTAIPGAKFTFKFNVIDEVRSFPSRNLEIHFRVFDTEEGIDVQLLSENEVVINAINYPLPQQKKVRSRNPKPFLVNRFLNITKSIYTGGNYISFVVPKAIKQGIAVVQVVKRIETESLFGGIPRLPMPASCRVVSNKVKEENKDDDDDDDICINDTRLPLQCPLSLSRIKTPAKGKYCSHQKCFDLEIYIRFCVQNGLWECPICNKTCKYQDLVIDEWFSKALTIARPDDLFISIDKDGNFEIDYTQDGSDEENTAAASGSSESVKVKTEPKSSTETPFEKHPIDIVCLDSDDDGDDDDTQPPTRQSPTITTNTLQQQPASLPGRQERDFSNSIQQIPSPPEVPPPPSPPQILQYAQQGSSPISLLSPPQLRPQQRQPPPQVPAQVPQQLRQNQSPQDRIGIDALVNSEKTNSESPSFQNQADEFIPVLRDSQFPSVSMAQRSVQDNYYSTHGDRASFSPTSFSSASRERLNFINRRRYGETNRTSTTQNKITKMQTEKGVVDLIEIGSSSDSDTNNDFESSSSSSSSSEYEGCSLRMSRPAKRVRIQENARRRNNSINIDSDSSSTSEYSGSDSEPEYVKSSYREEGDDARVSKTETAVLPSNEPSSKPANPPPKTSEPSTVSSAVNPSAVNSSATHQSNEQNTNESVPIKRGFETMNIRGKVIPKPIVLVPSKNQIAGRSASERQISLPPPSQTEPPLKKSLTDTSHLITPESLPRFKSQPTQPIQLIQQNKQQQQMLSPQDLTYISTDFQPIQQAQQDQIIPSNEINLSIGAEEEHIVGSLMEMLEEKSPKTNQQGEQQQQGEQGEQGEQHQQGEQGEQQQPIYPSQYPFYYRGSLF